MQSLRSLFFYSRWNLISVWISAKINVKFTLTLNFSGGLIMWRMLAFLKYGINYRAESDWQDFVWGKKIYQNATTMIWKFIYLFCHYCWEFIICTLILVVMLKEWKLLAASQIKREYSSINFQPIWLWSFGGIKIIQDYNICLHWSNIPFNENQPNLTGENKNVHSFALWISVMAN